MLITLGNSIEVDTDDIKVKGANGSGSFIMVKDIGRVDLSMSFDDLKTAIKNENQVPSREMLVIIKVSDNYNGTDYDGDELDNEYYNCDYSAVSFASKQELICCYSGAQSDYSVYALVKLWLPDGIQDSNILSLRGVRPLPVSDYTFYSNCLRYMEFDDIIGYAGPEVLVRVYLEYYKLAILQSKGIPENLEILLYEWYDMEDKLRCDELPIIENLNHDVKYSWEQSMTRYYTNKIAELYNLDYVDIPDIESSVRWVDARLKKPWAGAINEKLYFDGSIQQCVTCR